MRVSPTAHNWWFDWWLSTYDHRSAGRTNINWVDGTLVQVCTINFNLIHLNRSENRKEAWKWGKFYTEKTSLTACWQTFTVTLLIFAYYLGSLWQTAGESSRPSYILSKKRGMQLRKSYLGLTGKSLFISFNLC